jgi:predicted alpha/beta-fold hydrolase
VFNQRGCSGELNRLLSSYHSGKSEDLREVIVRLTTNYEYDSIFLIGVSLGGNIVLKYCGEEGESIHPSIKAAVTISVPTDLEDSAKQLAKASNSIYMKRFLKSLTEKTLCKIEAFPDCGITKKDVLNCKNFIDFDNLYTAPVHGFKNAVDYWNECSSKSFIPHIKVRSLLLTSQNDPFLGEGCYPIKEAQNHEFFHLETTKHGGHVGFADKWPLRATQFLEKRPYEFIEQVTK